MEDNQAAVAGAPAVTEYPSSAYGEYNALNPDDSTTYSIENVEGQVHSGAQETAVYAADGSNYVDVNAYSKVSSSGAEGVSVDAAYHSAATVPVSENATGYENAVNGSTHEVASNVSVEMINGTIPSETGTTADQQFEMSSEEERLWGLVRANCLDFNAWTSLIQETEKENNILKIRKVYDAFLAEFPLCFGYWKKYADHEGRLDTINKVVEVYERAVLAVTYSVDIWVHYCQFAISTHGDPENIRRCPVKVVKLYERCLIACANYPEFWIRYVLCMEASGSMELANNALARATQVFVKKQPDIHLFAARFKELSSDFLGARAEYQLLHSEFSTALLEAAVRHANMEYRLGNKEAAFSVFEEAIAAELGRELSNVLPLMFVQYARFSFLVAGDAEKAREILAGALEKVQLSRPFLEAAIHLESILPLPKRIEYLDSLVEKFSVPSPDNPHVASPADREDVSSIFLEFLDIFGDAQSIKKADNRHSLLFLRHRSTISSRKRRAEDYLGSEKSKMSKTFPTDPSMGQSVMGAYPNAQQWTAGYAQQQPAWPQPAQTSGQQWNPGYAPQAGYSAYGSYGAYPSSVQMPASAPQSTVYGAYPTTSSVQAYPPQSYAQPAPAYAQQPAPAAASQQYYGSYY